MGDLGLVYLTSSHFLVSYVRLSAGVSAGYDVIFDYVMILFSFCFGPSFALSVRPIFLRFVDRPCQRFA